MVNASTIAEEVERPQHTYPRAMIPTLIICPSPTSFRWRVRITGLPAGRSRLDHGQISPGDRRKRLRVAIVAGAMMSGFGMFNALVMSYSRLPLAMARDGMLPRVFAKIHPKTGAPWVSVLVMCRGLGAVPWGLGSNAS